MEKRRKLMAKVRAIKDRIFKSNESKKEFKKKLKELTDSCNLPQHMGELFLREIILSDDEANSHLRERAVLLGLAENAE